MGVCRRPRLFHFWGSHGSVGADCISGGGMDHLHRLIVAGISAVLLCVLSLVPLWAHAIGQVPKQTSTIPCYKAYAESAGYGACFGSQSAAAADAIARYKAIIDAQGSPYNYTMGGAVFSGGQTFEFTEQARNKTNGALAYTQYRGGETRYSATTGEACPVNSTEGTAGLCQCNVGFRDEGGLCEPYSCAQQNLGTAEYGPFSSGSLTSSYVCDTSGANRGCTLKFSPDGAFEGASGWWVQGTESYTGGKCQGTGTAQTGSPGATSEAGAPGADHPDNAPTDQNPSCPSGKVPGTVNGQTVCYTPSSSTGTPTGTTTTDGSGNTTGSTTTQTSCNASACTTTVTTRDGAGNTTGTTTTSESYTSYCSKNAGSTACAATPAGSGDDDEDSEKSSFGGTCLASFTCSGDAIQCAMAKEQHKRNCELFETATVASDVGSMAIASGEAQPEGHPANSVSTVAINLATQLDRVPMFGSSSACPSDVTFEHQGHSFTLPFSAMCPYMRLLGAALVAAAYITAGFIVFRKN